MIDYPPPAHNRPPKALPMPNYICRTCGVQFAETPAPPDDCPICLDPRQYVGWDGQRWTTMDDLIREGYRSDLREEEPGLLGVGMAPPFSIGQRALLVQTPNGNVLYDCVSVLDEAAVREIGRLGGIAFICFSHPHFYDSMVEFSRAFGNAPIIVPEADREHVMRPDPAIRYWNGEPLELLPGVTLIQCGGHFAGSAALHWRDGADGGGALLVGDTITVVPDRRYVSFMTSYPNLIPMSAAAVRAILDAIAPYRYDRIYGGWWGRNIMSGAEEAVRRSADRYIRHINPA